MALVAVFSAPFLGGSELFNLEFLRRAAARGVTVDAVVPAPGALADALRAVVRSVQVVPIPRTLTALSRFDDGLGGRAMRASRDVAAYRALLRETLEQLPGPLCCLGFRAQLAVAAAGVTRRRPTCWVVHEVVPGGPYGWLWARASRRCAAVFTYSHAAAEQPLLRSAPTEICDVRFDLARLAAVRAPLAPPITLGLVGDLFPLKNHLAFLDVVRTLRNRGHVVEGLIVGRDVSTDDANAGYVRSVRAGVAESGGLVRLVQASPAEMPDRFAEIDVLLHLSTVPESFGRVCVEAMAAGRPVVAFGHGAVTELVEDGRTGVLCPPADVAAVVVAVERLRADRGRYAELSGQARSTALARWSDAVAGRTIGDALSDFAGRADQVRRSNRI
jgi:hypothetical protein